ncbi:MAG: hypothetical protein HFH72_08840 [Lachnospiraceae bacterium]|nr:hypothetical protein [Lachnospiraceae bacterium]
MKYLEFDVKNMSITRTSGDKGTLISGAIDYFGIHFNFDEEFADIPGAKTVLFSKGNISDRCDLVENKCMIPNWILADKEQFSMRVISGNIIGTKWAKVTIEEGGIIMPETPEEEPPESMEYVKTASGENAAPYLRASTNGLEYSQDGENWNSGVSGVPEVPARPKDAIFGRMNGDWVRIDKMIEEAAGGDIKEVKVDGTALTPVDGSVDIDLSAYEKTADADAKYAEKSTVEALQTLAGTASQLTALDYSETDIPTIVTKINEVIGVLQARGIASE